MRPPSLSIYYVSRRVSWIWTVLAIAMLIPSYLGQIWIWFFLTLISIPTIFSLRRKIHVDVQYKQILEQIIWMGLPMKKSIINVDRFRGIKIEKVITGDLNTGGMGSTHYYHSYRTFIEYNETDSLQLETSLSAWQLEPTHELAKSLKLNVFSK